MEIAIKRLRAACACSESALVQEALILSSLKNRALPQPIDLRLVDGEWFLFLELIHGEPLAECGPRMTSRQIVRCLRDVLAALVELHAADLLHLDLTPANVLVDEDGQARLIDFGLARRRGGDDGAPAAVGGTPGFVAPEVFD